MKFKVCEYNLNVIASISADVFLSLVWFSAYDFKMSFDLDDPLADILSGGSDDSFFDDDILGKKKTPKKSTPLASKDNKKNALFNLNDDIKPSGSISTDTKHTSRKEITDINLDSIPKPTPVTPSRGPSTSKEQIKTPIKSNDPLDFVLSGNNDKSLKRLGSLDMIATPKMDATAKTFEKRKSSISILDDLLGPSTKTSTQAKTSSTAKNDFDFEGLLGKPESHKRPTTAASKPSLQAESAKIENVAKTMPSIKSTKKNNDDWLGIFNKEDSNPENLNATDDPVMPAWLVKKDSQTSKSSASIPKPKDPAPRAEVSKTDVPNQNPKGQDDSMKDNPPPVFNRSLETIFQAPDVVTRSVPGLMNTLNISNEDITQEGAALYMQQQESQLMVALQLKAQEEKLAALQQRQEESKKIQQQASMAQQTQVAAMLETQAAHRQQMQAIIAGHQQRINERIKALLTPIQSESNADDEIMASGEGEPDRSGSARRETPHAKEKKQLLQLVQTLQENHDKEIDLMETSYRRQLAITDAALGQSEDRMRAETERLVKHYVERLEWAELEARAQRARAQDDAKMAEQRHEQLLSEERGRSAEIAKVLREQQAALMDNIKNAVAQERALVENWSTVSAELATLVGEVRGSRSAGERLLEVAREWKEGDAREAERALLARESQLQEMLQQLSKDRERFDKEKAEDRDTVKLLEARLRQMTQSVEEETSAMKQRRMEFEFEKATFNKQTEFAKNLLKKQDEEIKMIKEEMQREYQEKLSKLEEERGRIGTDSAVAARERLTAHSLKQELEKLKAELQSQMEDVSEERSRVNIEKQQLHMEEQGIIAKSRDLDLLAKSAIEKHSLADRKHSEAEYSQRKYEDRVRRLQEHVISLNTREKDIAREKVALSRERLQLHNDKRQLENRQQCSLCRSMQNQQVPFLNLSAPIHSDVFPNLNSEYLSMGVSRDRAAVARHSASALEQEMSNLLIRGTSTVEENAVENNNGEQNIQHASMYKEMMDPKLLLLRLDVQQVISNLSERHEPPKEN